MKDLEAIQNRVRKVVETSDQESFIYDLLRAYGLPKASVTRLESGDYNQAKSDGEILWKKKLFFATAENGQLLTAIEGAGSRKDVLKHEPRFILITDFETLVARDTKTDDSLDIRFDDLQRKYEFFLPWAGIEKAQVFHENPADIKAAEKMAVFYDEILRENPDLQGGSHDLNVFFARLLFCLFAEDTGIFKKDIFSNAIKNYTDDRGRDVARFLDELFVALDTESRNAHEAFYLRDFPYVNGGLFSDRIAIPRFSSKARRILLESASELDWSEINPDIFGSMVQAVVHEDQRAGLGMHYTSVPNIMKVIGPLFLDDLREEFEKAKGSKTKLQRLWKRISNMKFFDPACGSGNFLIITYKEVRKLEIEIIAELERVGGGQAELYFSEISLDQFYGIEIDDFAHEVAVLSLWLAEHQMNMVFRERFGRVQPYLPLKQAGRIVCGNAARLDWKDVCPADRDREVYVMGNPPYVGSQTQTKAQKADLDAALPGVSDRRRLDYIGIWFVKASAYIQGNSNARAAFVSTSSVTQGQQVGYLWPHVLDEGIEIGFAHRPFKWANSARDNAGVAVVIVGLRKTDSSPHYIFDDGRRTTASRINAYLVDGPDTVVGRRRTVMSPLPAMQYGNMAVEYGHLTLSTPEKDTLLAAAPEAVNFVRPYLGGEEILNGSARWCLWIEDEEREEALTVPEIAERVEKVRRDRLKSSRKSTRTGANSPHQFESRHMPKPGGRSLALPRTSSERRSYIPAAFFDEQTVLSSDACVVYDAEFWHFAVLSSRMHMTWVRAVAGRLEDRIRYSSTVCYNTFPFPDIASVHEHELAAAAKQVIIARERHSEKTLANLYDPDEMPDHLREAHAALDRAVDRCYRTKPFESDEERLQVLFEMYEEMTRAEAD